MDSSNADPWEGFTGQSQADADDALIMDPLVRQISELRAALGDSEARRAELEAANDEFKAFVAQLDDAGEVHTGSPILRLLSTAPSVVLEDRDRENRAIGWDEGERHESEYLSTFGQFCPGEHCNPHRGESA